MKSLPKPTDDARSTFALCANNVRNADLSARLHSVSKQLFCKLKPSVAHDCMVEVLRNRMNNQSKKEFIINMYPQARPKRVVPMPEPIKPVAENNIFPSKRIF